jgi:hypothetical protein
VKFASCIAHDRFASIVTRLSLSANTRSFLGGPTRVYGNAARLSLTLATKKSATGDVAPSVTTKGGWRSVLKRREVFQ